MKVTKIAIKTMVVLALAGLMTACVSKKKYDEAVANAAAQKAALESQLAAAQQENEELQSQAEELEKNLNLSQEEIADLSKQVAENNAKIQHLEDKIKEVFSTYDPEHVTVEERHGKLYIIVDNGILFEPGSDKLTKDSQGTIDRLAEAFNAQPDLDIIVEGHTDNKPIVVSKGKYNDNWHLSTARALSVIDALDAAGVDHNRLTASGKGDTQPVADNETKEGRMKNRRTEFVIIPPMDGLFNLHKNDYEVPAEGSR